MQNKPEPAHVDRNVSYLPQPNRVELVITDVPPPEELTRTSFLLPITDDDGLMFAHNRRRGIEFPGGHIEPGEDYIQAARREGREEVGVECGEIVQIGYMRMTSEGDVPPGWKYPHPESYQVFHAGRVESIAHYVENEECRQPEVFSGEEVEHLDGSIGIKARILHEAALRALAEGARS